MPTMLILQQLPAHQRLLKQRLPAQLKQVQVKQLQQAAIVLTQLLRLLNKLLNKKIALLKTAQSFHFCLTFWNTIYPVHLGFSFERFYDKIEL